MSVSTKNRSITVGGGGGYGGDDDHDSVGVGIGGRCKETDDSEEEGDHNKDFGKNKGKRISCFRFRKVKRKFLRRKRKGLSGNSERRRELCGGGGGGGGCYLCLKRPLTSDSGGESQTSDPNSPNFTYEMLRVFIEKSDFYSNECNPHLDVESKPCSNQDDK